MFIAKKEKKARRSIIFFFFFLDSIYHISHDNVNTIIAMVDQSGNHARNKPSPIVTASFFFFFFFFFFFLKLITPRIEWNEEKKEDIEKNNILTRNDEGNSWRC